MIVRLAVVALLGGGIGVTSPVVIAVLERRREIGLRRALGATRSRIRALFLTEAVLAATLAAHRDLARHAHHHLACGVSGLARRRPRVRIVTLG